MPALAQHLLLLPFLLVLLVLLHVLPVASSSASPASGDFNCDAYDPAASQTAEIGCLHRLNLKPDDYEECRDPEKDTTCYIFIQEPPFITLNDVDKWDNSARAINDLQKPFRCGDYARQFLPDAGISGIALRLHNLTSSANDLCIWGGHSDHCKFNQLVDYTAVMANQGYRFAVTGLLLELPSRQCTHECSAPFVDNSMIIIGKRDQGSRSNAPLHQLTRPFHWGAWAIFGGIIVLFAIVCISIAVRFHVFRGRSLITAFFIFAGERDEAMAHEMSIHHGDASHAISFATKYGLAMTLYRISLLAFVGIFVLFYEVAVVNFLFQQQSVTLTKSVTNLSPIELESYSVLKDSALENVWNVTVGSGRRELWTDETIPWDRCPTATQCIRDALNGETKFIVTFEIMGKYLLLQESGCDVLTIFETKDILYQFNAGWLYNSQTNATKRRQVDRELVGLRIDGTTRVLIQEHISDFSCETAVKPDIGPMIVLIPCLIFVVPPLIVSIGILFLWKPRRARGDDSDSDTAMEKDKIEQEVDKDVGRQSDVETGGGSSCSL